MAATVVVVVDARVELGGGCVVDVVEGNSVVVVAFVLGVTEVVATIDVGTAVVEAGNDTVLRDETVVVVVGAAEGFMRGLVVRGDAVVGRTTAVVGALLGAIDGTGSSRAAVVVVVVGIEATVAAVGTGGTATDAGEATGDTSACTTP